jgi:hypothetical protein
LFAILIISPCVSFTSQAGKVDWIGTTAILCLFWSPFCVVGWLLSLPVILRIRRTDKWRFWFLLVLGTGIGPAIMFSIAICFEVSAVIGRTSSPNWDRALKNDVYIATAISCLTTLVYLSIVRHIESKRQPARTKAE